MLPQVWFKEHLVRVFLRPTGDDDINRKRSELLKKAFKKWCVKNTMKEPKMREWHVKEYLRPTYATGCGTGQKVVA